MLYPLLHPFMPFVTEEIYLSLPHEKESICLESWPSELTGIKTDNLNEMDMLISMIQKVREVKRLNNLKPSAPLTLMAKDLNGNIIVPKEGIKAMLLKMAKTSWEDNIEGDLTVETVKGGTIYIPSGELLDKETEIAKLTLEKERLEKEISRGKGILSNAGFLAKAPEAKVQAEKNKLADYEKQFEAVCARLNLLQNK